MENFVLIHGGMIGGNCWNTVRKLLQHKNHSVLTPTLTGLGEKKHLSHPDVDLETHIQDILNAIFYAEVSDIILVGHSYGGMVMTGVADRIPNMIKKMIYVAAVLPTDGESMFDAIRPEISSFLHEGAQQGNGWEVPVGAPESYGIHASEEVKWFEKMTTPHPLKSFQQKLHFNDASFHGIERVYIKASKDDALDNMAKRAEEMGMPCYKINSGHFPMLTSPEALVDLFFTPIKTV